ncbi:MAG: SIMPL domain-containing protein, partial [Candidatus Margulisbacteria bacterium]|nr:SIMPL domain-containing protein [Candidatus Margulisiibacteriota bacterium]
MKNPLFIIVALLCLTLAAAAKDQSIIVNGFGSVQVEPDTANVQLGVECSGKSAQAAQSENARLMKQVVEAIEKNGIAKKKLATSNFNIWPEVRYEQNQPPKTVGYRCGNQVNVTIEDLTLISKVIDSGIAAGANNVRGLHFSRQDDKEAKRLALSDAVAAAS